MKSKISNNKKILVSENTWFWLLLAPFLLMFFLFTVIPILSSAVLSMFEFDLIAKLKFVGFNNYIRLILNDNVFSIVLSNTVLFALIAGPLEFLLSFVLAWFINEFRPIVRTILSFLFYAPALVGNAYFVWQVAFSNDSYGYVNSLLLSLGLITSPIQWLKNADYVATIVLVVQLWQSMGVSFLANISGLQNINNEMYEAGAIDGIRNRWQELWYITLPTMKHMLLFSAVMQIASSFSISAIAIQLAGYPSVEYAADTIVSYMADVGTVRYEMGYASAMSVVLFAIMGLTRWIVSKALNGTGR